MQDLLLYADFGHDGIVVGVVAVFRSVLYVAVAGYLGITVYVDIIQQGTLFHGDAAKVVETPRGAVGNGCGFGGILHAGSFQNLGRFVGRQAVEVTRQDSGKARGQFFHFLQYQADAFAACGDTDVIKVGIEVSQLTVGEFIAQDDPGSYTVVGGIPAFDAK